MTEIKLLPLYAELQGHPKLEIIKHYARANMEPLQAEIEALRAEVAKSERSVEHTHQWYAVRLEKIKEVAKRVGLWSEVAAIIANGSSSIYDPPTYAQQLNTAKHEAKAHEARAERLAEALQRLVNSFPEESILLDGGCDMAEVDEACEAYDAARTLLRDQEARNG